MTLVTLMTLVRMTSLEAMWVPQWHLQPRTCSGAATIVASRAGRSSRFHLTTGRDAKMAYGSILVARLSGSTPRGLSDGAPPRLSSAVGCDPGGQGSGCGRCAYCAGRDRQGGQDCHHCRRGDRAVRREDGGERMGPRVMRRLPKFIHGFIDRHGKPRFYFRRAGHKKVRLPGLPWSPEFMAAYQEALEDAPRLNIGATRSRPGTVAAAVAG